MELKDLLIVIRAAHEHNLERLSSLGIGILISRIESPNYYRFKFAMPHIEYVMQTSCYQEPLLIFADEWYMVGNDQYKEWVALPSSVFERKLFLYRAGEAIKDRPVEHRVNRLCLAEWRASCPRIPLKKTGMYRLPGNADHTLQAALRPFVPYANPVEMKMRLAPDIYVQALEGLLEFRHTPLT